MKHSILFSILLLAVSLSTANGQSTSNASNHIQLLNGKWGVALDTTEIGFQTLPTACTDSMLLPGTTDMRQKGKFNTNMTETNQLSREYIFEGKALYTKTVKIPSNWKKTTISLYMERTKPTTLWVDGKKVGSNDDISTPQIYNVTDYMTPGKHDIAILVDNGETGIPHQVFSSSHAYSNSTQTNWNGIIGDFYLESSPLCGIADIQTYPDVNNKSVKATIIFRNEAKNIKQGKLSLYAECRFGGKRVRSVVIQADADLTLPKQTVELPLGDNAVLWDEFTPAIYHLYVTLSAKQYTDVHQATFGLRKFEVKGKQFAINNKVTFLRGKHDGCVFPLIGHTAMDVASWRHYFQVAKQYGINHYRFHSWCPPEACFEAADIEGIYLQPELPIWGNIDIKDTTLCNFLLKEGRHIQKAYSNHPSFVMFALGNELQGADGLAMLIQTFKSEEKRHLFGAGSNDFLGMNGKQADEQYFTTCRVGKEEDKQFNTHARASFSFADAYDGGYLNHTYPNSVMNFSTANALCDIPVISHETGQFQVYPNYEEIKKYTGVLKPRNFEVFKQRLKDAGMADQAHDFLMASGKWSALLYRADIEMNLRTPDWGGFQLLDLQDYPGQGSAYVGILDAFMDSKGLIAPEEWHHFCCETVPLFCTSKFCWTNKDTLSGEIRIANYSNQELKDKYIIWTLTDSRHQVLDKNEMPISVKQGEVATVATIKPDISSIKKAEKVELELSIFDTPYKNTYSFWIYPANNDPKPTKDIVVAYDLDETVMNKLSTGSKVLLFPNKEKMAEQTVGALFQTDYWNYRMFKTVCENLHRPVSPGTMGILTDPKHPALEEFPCEFHTNWQWFPIIKQSYPMILDRLPQNYRPIVQVIDNIERNHKLGLLYELKVGNGKLLVCMSDLKSVLDKPEARQFYSSLLRYMNSSDFEPALTLKPEELKELFTSKVEGASIKRLGNISYE